MVATVDDCKKPSPVTVIEVRGVRLPTAPVKMSDPPVPTFIVILRALLRVLPKVRPAPDGVPPLFVVSRVTFADKVVGPDKKNAPPDVVTLPLIEILLPPP